MPVFKQMSTVWASVPGSIWQWNLSLQLTLHIVDLPKKLLKLWPWNSDIPQSKPWSFWESHTLFHTIFTLFLPFCLPLKLLPFPIPSQIHDFYNYYWYINTHKTLLWPFSVSYMCICLKLTTWFWIAYLWKRTDSLAWQPLISYSSSSRDGVLWHFFPIHIGMSTGVVIIRVVFRQPYCWNFLMLHPCHV